MTTTVFSLLLQLAFITVYSPLHHENNVKLIRIMPSTWLVCLFVCLFVVPCNDVTLLFYTIMYNYSIKLPIGKVNILVNEDFILKK